MAGKRKPRKKTAKKKSDAVVARGKRKRSIARSTVKKGSGKIHVNSKSVESFNSKFVRSIMIEPLGYVGPEANNLDVSVNVSGGVTMGQAQAVRTAIAKALIVYFPKLDLKKKFLEIDRSLVIEDPRRVEPKKYRGPKARARFQKSYR